MSMPMLGGMGGPPMGGGMPPGLMPPAGPPKGPAAPPKKKSPATAKNEALASRLSKGGGKK